MPYDKISDALIWYLIFLFSTVFHEAAHAWTASRLGDQTASRQGLVTLDPTRHIQREPFGMVIIPLISFYFGGWMIGWASTPYSPHWAMQYPKRSATMSVAGPIANFILVGAMVLVIKLGLLFHFFDLPAFPRFSQLVLPLGPDYMDYIAKVVSITFSLNLLLGVFNLLPVPPLDGCSLPLFFLNSELTERYRSFIYNPTFNYVGILIAWKLVGGIFHPIYRAVVGWVIF